MKLFQTFVINLEKDKDRLSFMNKQLESLSLPYTRIEAVNGKELPLTLKRYLPTGVEVKSILNPGEIGCALSHRSIYERIVQENIPYSLILEDDVILPPSFKELLEREVRKNSDRKNWEFLSFDYFAYGLTFFFNLWLPGVKNMLCEEKVTRKKALLFCRVFLKGVLLLPIVFLEEIQMLIFSHRAITPIKPTSFAGAYLLTLEGAKKLLQVHDKIVYIADRLPSVAAKKTGLIFKIYTPLIVTQAKERFASNLHNV